MNRSIETDRGTFNIREYGDVNNPPVILLHGWPQTSYCWHHCIPYLTDFHIIAPDLRGMGDSNRSLELQRYEKDELAEDIFAIAEELGLEQFYLGGHDWGGGIVQEMAFLYPEKIKKLIIINMVILNNKSGQEKAQDVLIKHLFRSSWYQFFMSIKDLPEALIEGKEEIWIRFFSRGISNPVPEDSIAEYIRCFKIPNTITTTSNLYRTFYKDRERWKEFEKRIVEIPTKIIHGILDPVIIKEYLYEVEKSFAQIEIEYLKGGHFIVDEQPKAVADSIREFFVEI